MTTPGKNGRILVVDDEVELMRSVRFAAGQYEVKGLSNPVERWTFYNTATSIWLPAT
jgi:hypothetical protein